MKFASSVSYLLFLGYFLSFVIADKNVEETSSLYERIANNRMQERRQIFENFKKSVYTVPDYTGKEKANPSDPPFDPTPECGDQFLNLTEGAFGSITSPNYPDRYSPNLQCEWTIESIPGTVVEATFFDVKTQPWLFTFADYVMVSIDGTFDNYRRFSGDVNNKMPFTFISNGNRLRVRFVTSPWLNFRGFKLSYVVRPMKPSDVAPPENEFGSAFNNDLVAVCNSKPIGSERINTKFIQEPLKIESSNSTHRIVRIVNGVETLPHQYPFMVAILADESFFCGGSLIDEYHILTAAHCLESIQRIDLFFGVYNMSNRAENLYARQVRTIQFPDIANSVFIHPNYNEESGANDIAILRVPKLKTTKYVQPIYLPSVYSASTSFSGWTLKAIGWGATEPITTDASSNPQVSITPILRQASATVITQVECRSTFQGSVTGNNICTSNPIKPLGDNSTQAEEEDTEIIEDVQYESPCHGDSGGPLFADFSEELKPSGVESETELNGAGASIHECVNAKPNGASSPLKQDTVCQRPKDSNSKWFVQVGVASFGSRVCGRDIPVVYTRVTAYLQWIAYITGRHG